VLTEEEKLVLKECERDSFYKRALPLSLGNMLAAHMLVKGGYWSPNPKYGSLPKVFVLGGIGYFLGKLSYLSVCQQKILDKIPNSNLAAQIRKAKGLPETEAGPAAWDGASAGVSSPRIKDDYSTPEGLDDRFRPTIDSSVKESETPSQDKIQLTYEELRRRNRQEYKDQISKAPPPASGFPPFKDTPPKPFPDARSGDSGSSLGSSTPPYQASPSKRRTNIWGDPIDE
ncbi:unnamed protein product, partial [Candidula unifasciata]